PPSTSGAWASFLRQSSGYGGSVMPACALPCSVAALRNASFAHPLNIIGIKQARPARRSQFLFIVRNLLFGLFNALLLSPASIAELFLIGFDDQLSGLDLAVTLRQFRFKCDLLHFEDVALPCLAPDRWVMNEQIKAKHQHDT